MFWKGDQVIFVNTLKSPPSTVFRPSLSLSQLYVENYKFYLKTSYHNQDFSLIKEFCPKSFKEVKGNLYNFWFSRVYFLCLSREYSVSSVSYISKEGVDLVLQIVKYHSHSYTTFLLFPVLSFRLGRLWSSIFFPCSLSPEVSKTKMREEPRFVILSYQYFCRPIWLPVCVLRPSSCSLSDLERKQGHTRPRLKPQNFRIWTEPHLKRPVPRSTWINLGTDHS